MKINKFTSLFATCLLMGLTACSNDNVSDADSNNSAKNKDLTGKTSFSITSEAKTRTSGVYDDSGVNFYWTTNDNIWVNSGSATSPTLTASSSNNITSTTASAKFYFDGTYTAASYPVRYTGNASTSGNTVTIATSQNQDEANNATQLGTVGDCGVGTATRQTDGSYKFTLSHKASYITFMPYYSKEALAASAVVTQINVTVANGESLAGTFNFSDSGLGAVISSSSNSVTLTLNGTSSTTGFPIPTTATASKNAAIMVVAPGTYSTFKVTYTLYDSVTGTESTISYTYRNINCTPGKNQKISTDLGMATYTSRKADYYMWDAKKNYWDGYETSQPLLNNAANTNYAKSSADSRWYNTAFTKNVQTKAINSCKDQPTFEALTWYIGGGSPQLDNKTLWVFANHLYVGGIWLKKHSKIPGFISTMGSPTTFTWDLGLDIPFSVNISGKPKASVRSDYFYLPALGKYTDGKLTGLGVSGYYWASTPNPVNNGDRSKPYGKVISANCLRFTIDESDIDNVYVRSYYERYVGMQVQKFE